MYNTLLFHFVNLLTDPIKKVENSDHICKEECKLKMGNNLTLIKRKDGPGPITCEFPSYLDV